MKRGSLILFLVLFLFTACGKEDNRSQKTALNIDNNPSPVSEADTYADADANTSLDTNTDADVNTATDTNTVAEGNIDVNIPLTKPPVTLESDGSIRFDLSAAASILVRSISGSKGLTLIDPRTVNDISDSLSVCEPYDSGVDYKPGYDYTLIFYDAAGAELATLQAYDNYIIAYDGKIYCDSSKQLNMWKIRKPYIEAAKAELTCDTTSFQMNGAVYDLHKLDPAINAITKYSWLGNEDYPDPSLILECHINPKIGYLAVFDVEKMDYVFGTYGTAYTYKDYSVSSLVYAFLDCVYNYYGDCLYYNTDENVYIAGLEYDKNSDYSALHITLQSIQEEKRTEVTRINYHKAGYDEVIRDFGSIGVPGQLAEFEADLNADDNKETIRISKAETGGDLGLCEISDAYGNSLWLETAHTSHAGWNSVYLCRMDGADYLLVFNPYQCTGTADFRYVLFYLTGQDTIDIIDSGNYSFSYDAEDGAENAFDEDTFRIFADKVNSYLQNSYLLMSTEEGVLQYSTEGNRLPAPDQYETEKWISEIKANMY